MRIFNCFNPDCKKLLTEKEEKASKEHFVSRAYCKECFEETQQEISGKINIIKEIDLDELCAGYDDEEFNRYTVDEEGNVWEHWLVRPGKYDAEIIGKVL